MVLGGLMKCTVCNGAGSFEDSGKFNNCFVCAGSGEQSMYFWENHDEGEMEREDRQLRARKNHRGHKKGRKHSSPRKNH